MKTNITTISSPKPPTNDPTGKDRYNSIEITAKKKNEFQYLHLDCWLQTDTCSKQNKA